MIHNSVQNILEWYFHLTGLTPYTILLRSHKDTRPLVGASRGCVQPFTRMEKNGICLNGVLTGVNYASNQNRLELPVASSILCKVAANGADVQQSSTCVHYDWYFPTRRWPLGPWWYPQAHRHKSIKFVVPWHLVYPPWELRLLRAMLE